MVEEEEEEEKEAMANNHTLQRLRATLVEHEQQKKL